ncbi:hypothetical protein AGMMS49921_04460 [Endomicrobiia bacterium]|nr:hypothetical protein AGMMS49921_04460 [Endomicrobiia bacterium]
MMLDLSFRPCDNKKWTASSWGHLSNEDAADAICAIKQLSTSKDSLKYVFLAHISNTQYTRYCNENGQRNTFKQRYQQRYTANYC